MLLTTEEFNSKRDQVLLTYARAWFSDMQSSAWCIKRTGISEKDAKLLWLFVFALNSYEHSDTTYNFITEKDVVNIFKRANSIQ